MKRIIPLLLASLIISTACKQNHSIDRIEISDKPFPLTLIKEKETKIDALGYPALFSLKNSGNIIVRMELKDTDFLTYDQNLELLSRHTIKYGEGPNECLLPIAVGADENHIIIFDVVTKKYYLYDADLRSRKNLEAQSVGWIPHGFNYSYKYNTVLSCVMPFNPSLGKMQEYRVFLRKFAADRMTYNEIFTTKTLGYLENYVLICARPIHFKIIDDHVYILKKEEYGIIKMDIEGKVLKEIQVTGLGSRQFSSRDRGDWIEAVGLKLNRAEFTLPENLWHANGILELAGGIAVIRITDYNPAGREMIDADYFDYDLNSLGKIKLPWFPMYNYPGQLTSDLFFFSKGNILYFIDTRETGSDEEYWLTRWRIEK
jgi:hypothetical protein